MNRLKLSKATLTITGTNEEKLNPNKSLIGSSETGKHGIEEVEFVFQQTKNTNLSIDFTLARGLNYYTGIIFEAKSACRSKDGQHWRWWPLR